MAATQKHNEVVLTRSEKKLIETIRRAKVHKQPKIVTVMVDKGLMRLWNGSPIGVETLTEDR